MPTLVYESTAALAAFVNALRDAGKPNGAQDWVPDWRPNEVFSMRSDVGFAHAGFREDDRVFLVDGVCRPLILRHADKYNTWEDRRYEVVFWANSAAKRRSASTEWLGNAIWRKRLEERCR